MKPALKLAIERPSNDEIACYYFEISEVREILKCSESSLRNLLDTGNFGQVLFHGKWYLPPDLSLIRKALWGDQ